MKITRQNLYTDFWGLCRSINAVCYLPKSPLSRKCVNVVTIKILPIFDTPIFELLELPVKMVKYLNAQNPHLARVSEHRNII